MRNMKRSLALVLALVFAFALAVPASAAVNSEEYFTDWTKAETFIKANYGDDAAEIIKGLKQVADLGMLEGSGNAAGDVLVNADKGLTRIEYIALLYRLFENKPIESTVYYKSSSVFPDMVGFNADKDWEARAIGYANWAYVNGVTTGVSATSLKFAPTTKMNYYDAALMILSALGVNKNYELGLIDSKGEALAASVTNELRFLTTMKIADYSYINLVRDLEVIDHMHINRAEAIALFYYALSANYVEYNAAGKLQDAGEGTVFQVAKGGEKLEGYISATKFANIDGTGAIRDGYVAVFNAGDYDEDGNVDYFQIDAAVAEQMGLKLDGFDNLRNLGEMYTIYTQVNVKVGNTAGHNKLTNVLTLDKTSGSYENFNGNGNPGENVYNQSTARSVTGNSNFAYDASDIAAGATIHYNFGAASATTISGWGTQWNADNNGILNKGQGVYKKIIWNEKNKIVRMFILNTFYYEAIGDANSDGKYQLNDSGDKNIETKNLLGYDADKNAKGTHVMTYRIGDTTGGSGKYGIFYLTATEGTATSLSTAENTVMTNATINGTSYVTMHEANANIGGTTPDNYTRALGATITSLLGKKVNYYFFELARGKYVLSAYNAAPTADPKSYAVVTSSYYKPAADAIPGVSEAADAIAVVTLLDENGVSKSYRLTAIKRGAVASGWSSNDTVYVNGNGDDNFKAASLSDSTLTYKGSGADAYPNTYESVNNVPFAYLVDGDNVVLFEIPTLLKDSFTSTNGASPIDSSKFQNMVADINGMRIDSNTAVFTNSEANKGINEVAKGSAISNTAANAAITYDYYALNVSMSGDYGSNSYSRLVVLNSGAGAANLLRNTGTSSYFYTLGAPTLIADGKATQSVLNSKGEVETLTTIKNGSPYMTGIGNTGGYYVEYTLNTSGEVNGVKEFRNGKESTAWVHDWAPTNDGDSNWAYLGAQRMDISAAATKTKLTSATYLVILLDKEVTGQVQVNFRGVNNSTGAQNTNDATVIKTITLAAEKEIVVDLDALNVTSANLDWAGLLGVANGNEAIGITGSGTVSFYNTQNDSTSGENEERAKIASLFFTNSGTELNYEPDGSLPTLPSEPSEFVDVTSVRLVNGSSLKTTLIEEYNTFDKKDVILRADNSNTKLTYLGTQGISYNGTEYMFTTSSSNPLAIFVISGSNGSKITAAEFAAMHSSRGDYNVYVHFNASGDIDRVFMVKK